MMRERGRGPSPTTREKSTLAPGWATSPVSFPRVTHIICCLLTCFLLVDGFGRLLLLDQSSYEGEWRMGIKHGKGKIIHPYEDVMEGIFENDQINGFGTLTCTNGNLYEGQWQNSKWHGQGTLMIGGNQYVGEFSNNLQEGYGEMIFFDGSKYAGDWKENKVFIFLPSWCCVSASIPIFFTAPRQGDFYESRGRVLRGRLV